MHTKCLKINLMVTPEGGKETQDPKLNSNLPKTKTVHGQCQLMMRVPKEESSPIFVRKQALFK